LAICLLIIFTYFFSSVQTIKHFYLFC